MAGVANERAGSSKSPFFLFLVGDLIVDEGFAPTRNPAAEMFGDLGRVQALTK
jgi:hypothetical protein